jgi:flagellar protein FliO/FliZ
MTAATLVQNGILAPASAATALQASAMAASASSTAKSAAATVPASAKNVPVAPTTAVPASATVATNAATAPATAPASATSARPTAAPFVPAPHRGATTTQVGTPSSFGKAPSPAGAVGGTVFALVFVLGLIFALAWLAKRMPGVAGGSNRALRVVASLSLGPREKVVVVDVGGRQLLLGVGAGGTRTLHTLDAPLPEAERPATPPFAQLLAQHFGKKA